MIEFPVIDSIAFELGPLKVRWYGLMYLAAFLGCYWMMYYRIAKRSVLSPVTQEALGDWIFYGGLGVILGGRIGYCLFYEPALFMDFSPTALPFLGADAKIPMWGALKIWNGGMSFHGGFLGVLVGSWYMGRKVGATFFQMMDFLAPTVPFGLFCGRMGNFINAELWGRVTEVPWGMVFPGAGPLPRHPSMLYEAFLEGLLLWAILWWYSASPRPRMAVSSVFLTGYGLSRFLVEFVREPDQHIGFIAFGWVTMGHILSLPMIIIGLAILVFAYRRRASVLAGEQR